MTQQTCMQIADIQLPVANCFFAWALGMGTAIVR